MDAKLAVGAASETVSVFIHCHSRLWNPIPQNLHTLISPQAVEDIPLNGRNLIQLIELSPAWSTATRTLSEAEIAPPIAAWSRRIPSNGQSDNANNNLIDGMDNNERLYGVIGVRPPSTPFRK